MVSAKVETRWMISDEGVGLGMLPAMAKGELVELSRRGRNSERFWGEPGGTQAGTR